ncbi:MAG: hypothetical protein ACREO8_08835 [Luteimonas sp.]
MTPCIHAAPSTSARRRRAAAAYALTALLLLPACQRSSNDPPSPVPATATSSEAATVDAQLSIVNNAMLIRYDATVASQADKDRIVKAFAAAYAPGRASGNVVVQADTRAAAWLASLETFVAGIDVPGVALTLGPQRIELTGHASLRDRARLLRHARATYPGYTLAGLFAGIDPRRDYPEDANTTTATVSSAAQKTEVVRTLNTIQIAFDADAGTVSADSLAGVSQAARALASTPDLRVQIGLAANGNDALARQRAEALKVQLIINGVNPGAIDTAVLPAGTGGATDTVSFSSAAGAARR